MWNLFSVIKNRKGRFDDVYLEVLFIEKENFIKF